ncbi:MAG TPA: TonB-dependent receptor, partial [Bacteroidia bacterium]|nr:TonB-dependent receptor [Bacteroidia bacterium]
MKKIFFCLLLLFPLCIFSQNSIRGKITDEKTGEALVGATVFIPDLHTGASTDTSGRFIIHNVPGGSFLAEIHMTGYTAKAIVLSSNDSANYIVITLSQKPTEMRAVVITSPSGSTDRQTNPVPTVIAGRDHLLAGSSTNLVAGISNIPGISQVSTGSAVSKPVIRGLGYNRVVVLRDGIRQEGQQWGDEHGIEIDEFEVDRIEIIKGPGSIMYGSDAMAGVINFMTPKPVDDGKWSGEFMTNYQTNANLAGLSFSEAGNFHGVSWMTRYSQKKAGNFSTPVDGHVLNSGFDEYDASGFLGLNRKWGYSRISFSTFNQRIGMPEGDRDSLGIFTKEIRVDDSTTTLVSVPESARKGFDNSILTPFQRINHNRVVWDNAFYFAHSKLTLTGGWQQNRRREFGDVFSPDEAGLHFLLTTANLDVKYFFPAVRQWSITSGASGQFQQSSNLGTEFLIPAYSQYDAGAFVFASRHFGKLFFSGGARADMRLLNASALYLDANGNAVDATNSVMTKFDAFSKNFYAFSGSLGLSYHISGKSVLRVNLSKGFRAPNLAELGANGVHEGTFRYEKGNHALNPENSYQLDAGFSCDADHVSFELDGFYNRITQYIFLQKVNSVSGGDSIIDPADPVPLFTFVQGNAALYGG